jgi:hypothetical protein
MCRKRPFLYMIYLLLLAFTSLSTFGQPVGAAYVHPFILSAVKSLHGEGVDSIYVYHSYCIGCESAAPVSELCEGFIQARIVWIQRGSTFTRNVYCDSTSQERKEIKSQVLDYYLRNTDILTERNTKKTRFLPPTLSHDQIEEFILIINDKWYHTQLTATQRKEKLWQEYSWIKPTILLSDLNREEIQKQ